jgi:hypothetical protein
VKARRILLLLIAWVSFDLTTPLPGAFEFEIQDSEIEHSLLAGRESHARREADASRSTPRERAEPVRSSRPSVSPAPATAAATGAVLVRQVRLAHRPSSSRASSSEDH